MVEPIIIPNAIKITTGVIDYCQALADAAYATERTKDKADTASRIVCAMKGPVPLHTDGWHGITGHVVAGLVIRSDGHHLGTMRLGKTVPLAAGTFYMIDPNDGHWTEIPDGDPEGQIIFSPHIMIPDGRKPKKLAHDMLWELIAEGFETIKARV